MNKHNINHGEADHMNTQYYLADEVDAELERYETARQEDARRLVQVKGERDVMREALQKIATTHRLDPRMASVAYGYQQIALKALDAK